MPPSLSITTHALLGACWDPTTLPGACPKQAGECPRVWIVSLTQQPHAGSLGLTVHSEHILTLLTWGASKL